MIEVNLLPEDLKRQMRSAGAGRRALVLGVVLVAAAVVGTVYFHLVSLAPRQRRHDLLQAHLSRLKRESEELTTLQSAIARIELRKRALAELYSRRILWSKKLDQLVDIIPKNVWLRSIELRAPRRRRSGSSFGGVLIMECYSAGTEEKGITLFRERLMGNEDFWKDVARMNRIQHRLREFPAYVEGVALEFTVELFMKAKGRTSPARAVRRRTRAVARKG